VNVVCDTGPLVAAANRRDRAHELAVGLVSALGRELIVPLPVIVEVDQLLRARLDSRAARLFLAAISGGEHSVAFLTPGLVRRAMEIDQRFHDLDLGFADASLMAVAERGGYPVLTFDFHDFRAAPPETGHWQLVVDEARYREASR
jgi:predicted nucleic acid-binding protein